MQNLPVTATPPVISAQAPAAAADNAPQATEPFSNVLARQRASAADGKQSDSKPAQPGSKQGATSSDASSAADGKDAAQDGTQAQASNAASTVPADILAALLPSVAATGATDKSATEAIDKSSAGDKAATQAPVPSNAAGSLPSDMLAMLLPANTVTKGVVEKAGEKVARETVVVADKKSRPQPLEAGVLSKARPAQAMEAEEVKSGPVRMKGDDKVEGMTDAVISKEKTFAATLEASVKAGAKTTQFDSDLAKASQQRDSTVALSGLAQSGAVAVTSGQNGVAQATQAVINTPVTDPAWGNEFNQKITWMATQQQQTAELHLNPPNLGPLEVVINVNGDQATAQFTSPHAAVRDVVEQALPKLRDMMADNGIMLGNATVSDQSPRDQQAGQAPEERARAGTSGKVDSVASGTVPASVAAPVRRHLGMVDTFV